MSLTVVQVAAEVAPWCKTGGLGDVVGALPGALTARGLRVLTYLPLYRTVRRQLTVRGARTELGPEFRIPVARGIEGRTILSGDTVFVDVPGLYDRDGIYGPFGDNDVRFATLSLAALQTAHLVDDTPVDVFHAHDWHAGLLPLYLESHRGAHPNARTVFTIHNLGYQGTFGAHRIDDLCLDRRWHHIDGYEWHGGISFMKAGIGLADAVTTVSPRYAQEIRDPNWGFGLDGFLRARAKRLVGILNGLDPAEWDPRTDPALAAHYDEATFAEGKAACRKALVAITRLKPEEGDLLVGVVSRLTAQKGIDLVCDLVPHLHAMGLRVFVLGSGDPALEDRMRGLSEMFGHHFHAHIGFDAKLARQVLAGVDALAIPSRFEPCGLTQLQAMRYGTVPVARATGGLADTVLDPGDDALLAGEGTGVVFEHATAIGIGWALDRCAKLKRRDPAGFSRIASRLMTRDVSWAGPAAAYEALYRDITEKAAP